MPDNNHVFPNGHKLEFGWFLNCGEWQTKKYRRFFDTLKNEENFSAVQLAAADYLA